MLDLNRKKKIQKIIYDAEVKSAYANISVEEIYDRVNEYLGLEELDEIIEDLRSGMKKSEAYEPYLPYIAISIIEHAEDRSLPVYKILEELSNISSALDKAKSKLIQMIIMPVLTFIVTVFLSDYVLHKIATTILGTKLVKAPFYLPFLMKFFIPINFAILGLFIFFVVVKPEHTPIVKNILKELESVRILNSVRLFYMANIPIEDIMLYVEDTSKGVVKEAFESAEPNIEGFLDVLETILDPISIASLESAFYTGKFKDELFALAEKKLRDLNVFVEGVAATANVAALGLIVIPLILLIIPYFQMAFELIHKVSTYVTNVGA
jgi:type II secretory pathway component PulF